MRTYFIELQWDGNKWQYMYPVMNGMKPSCWGKIMGKNNINLIYLLQEQNILEVFMTKARGKVRVMSWKFNVGKSQKKKYGVCIKLPIRISESNH